jgi:ribosomal protein S27E
MKHLNRYESFFYNIKLNEMSTNHKCSICGSRLYRTDGGGRSVTLQCSSDEAKFWNFNRGTEEQRKSHEHFTKSSISIPLEKWNEENLVNI